jgi:hypothetical protein
MRPLAVPPLFVMAARRLWVPAKAIILGGPFMGQ